MNNLAFYRQHDEHIAVYIPTTYGVIGKVSDSEIECAVDEAIELMPELFGGATVVEGFGAWTSDTAGVIQETVYIVKAAAYNLYDEDIDKVVAFAEEIRERFDQEAVTVECNNVMYFIDGAHTEYGDVDEIDLGLDASAR